MCIRDREFDRLQAQATSLADPQTELQTAVEALQAGRGGPAGNALLDPRFLEKPGKFDGTQAHWKDWSEQVQAFCDVADVALGAATKRYARADAGISMDLMSEDDKEQSTKLWYIMILLCKGDAAQKRRTICSQAGSVLFPFPVSIFWSFGGAPETVISLMIVAGSGRFDDLLFFTQIVVPATLMSFGAST